MRMMKNAFSKDATYGQYINPDERYYHGISQGGIAGGVYMALTQDVTRGALGVMGQPYNLLLNRSVDFDKFFAVLRVSWPDTRDQQLLLGYTQMLWDRVEPSGYTHMIGKAMLPDTPKHAVLMRAARGDHQVANAAAHVMARAIGASHVDTGIVDIYGLDKTSKVDGESGYVEYDFGLPEDPLCNIPQRACEDPHGKLRKLQEARVQLDQFFTTGVIENTCGGKCEFADMSGCEAGEKTEACVP